MLKGKKKTKHRIDIGLDKLIESHMDPKNDIFLEV